MNKTSWKKDYSDRKINECPSCGKDFSEHRCMECRSDIVQKTCWEYDGYCKKCFDYIRVEIPKIDALKAELGVKCLCNEPQCVKCLSLRCSDDNCPVHTIQKKDEYNRRWELAHGKPRPPRHSNS